MPNNPWENRRPHDAIYPQCTGEPAEEPVPWHQDMNHLNAQAAAMHRESFPNGCGFCGEQADHEMGEWWADQEAHATVHHYHAKDDPEASATEHSIVGHAQCGIDSGLPMA
jgi:hypothetical protein